jgi:hypothetical protein
MTTSTPVARFQLHDNHTLILRSDDTVTCDTCSLSATIAAACVFAYKNGVIRMTIDGAPLKRI